VGQARHIRERARQVKYAKPTDKRQIVEVPLLPAVDHFSVRCGA
jgi:hypothetical protein